MIGMRHGTMDSAWIQVQAETREGRSHSHDSSFLVALGAAKVAAAIGKVAQPELRRVHRVAVRVGLVEELGKVPPARAQRAAVHLVLCGEGSRNDSRYGPRASRVAPSLSSLSLSSSDQSSAPQSGAGAERVPGCPV